MERDVSATLDRLRSTFASGRTRPLAWRLGALERLEAMLREHEAEFLEALHGDLGKPRVEAYASEIGLVKSEIRHVARRLRRWLKPDRVRTPLHTLPGQSIVVREPLGVVLIIGPWNYPLQLLLAPLAGAIAAGNCAVLKPPEAAARTSAALARRLPEFLDRDAFAVVEGGPEETARLLEERFDSIFFTGGAAVGRLVMAAAAKHLTPVTLELGGKSPCIVERDVDLPAAARRIAWGKFLNAGQTCVAPDYVLVEETRERELLEALAASLREFYGDDPRQSPDYGRIVNDRHHERLRRLLADGEVVVGGDADAATRYIAPTVLRNVPAEAPVMQEEIFGPILPVLTVAGLDAALAFVNARPRPLALYLFSRDRKSQWRAIRETSSGGVCINDVVSHLIVPELPFGGVGASGLGAYHGRHSFETFSHRKSVLLRGTWPDLRLRYPPYDDVKLKWLRRLL